MAAVIFDPAEFRQRFPQFADPGKFSDAYLRMAFETACLIFDHTDASPAPYDPEQGIYNRKIILQYLTGHLLSLAAQADKGQAGPISSASEGSVSVSFAVPQVTDKSYFLLTWYGQTYWQLAAFCRIGGRMYPLKPFHPWG
jgi:hypothetical protein